MLDNCTVYCKCGCGKGLSVNFRFAEESGEVVIDTITSGFYAHQPGFFYRLKRRLLAAWYMLCGKEYLLHEVVLDSAHWNDFVAAINEMDIAYCVKNT